MKKAKIYKTVIQIKVLSLEPISNDEPLSSIIYEGADGGYSLIREDKILNRPIKGIKAVKEIINQGSDPVFFMMDENGNELED